jgi:hypothetical protein
VATRRLQRMGRRKNYYMLINLQFGEDTVRPASFPGLEPRDH